MRMTGGKGVDVVIDGVGGTLTGEALGCLAPGGTYAVVGYAAGREAHINLTDIISKAATVRGFTLRAFAPETLAAAQNSQKRTGRFRMRAQLRLPSGQL